MTTAEHPRRENNRKQLRVGISRSLRGRSWYAAAIIILLCSAVQLRAQNWIWAQQAIGASPDNGNSITVDPAGNAYVTGYFYGTVTFGSTVLTSAGLSDVFVAKYNSAGVLQWATRAGGTGIDFGQGIYINAIDNNVYVTGFFSANAGFSDSVALTSAGNYDIFVSKYSTSGTLLWAVRAGGPEDDRGAGIAVDNNGNAYITGSFGLTALFGSVSLTSASGNYDLFVAKYNSSGTVLWAKRGGGTGLDYGRAVRLDANNANAHVCGAIMGSATLGTVVLTGLGVTDAFVAKYDGATGNVVWARRGGSVGNATSARSIAVDASGNSYICGELNEMATFGTVTVNSSGTWPIGGGDIFLVKYDPTGNAVWGARAGGPSFNDYGMGVAVDGAGNPYMTGHYSGIGTFGNGVTLTSGGTQNIFVVKYNPAGTTQWAQTANAGNNQHSNAIATGPAATVYITGGLRGSAQHGSTTLGSTGGTHTDTYVAKLRPESVDPTNGGCANPSCLVDILSINTGFDQVAGVVYNQSVPGSPVQDGYWRLVEVPGPPIMSTPASVIQPHPDWVTMPGSNWISAYNFPNFNLDNPTGDPYGFERCFCVCDSGMVRIRMQVLVDNTAEVYFDGMLIGSQPDQTEASFQTPLAIDTTFRISSGAHCIRVDIRNLSSVAMGLDVAGTVESVALPGHDPVALFLSALCCNPNGTITVRKIWDKNCDGINDNTEDNGSIEPGLAGWTMTLNPGNLTGVTDVNGYVYFNDLPPGVYTVTEQMQTGWTQSQPGNNGSYTVTLAAHGATQVEFMNCKPVVCEEVSVGTLDSTCCMYKFSISNSKPDITQITYSISGGTIDLLAASSSCSYTTIPSQVFGSTSGTLTFSPACNDQLQMQVQATPNSSSGEITITWVVYHANGDSCIYTTEYQCSRSAQTECDVLTTTPYDNGGLNQSWHTFTIHNMKSPASPICFVAIALSPTPPIVSVNGLYVDGSTTAGTWSSPDVPISSDNGLPANSTVQFNMGIEQTSSWVGTITMTVHHCDGDSCVIEYGPWSATTGSPVSVANPKDPALLGELRVHQLAFRKPFPSKEITAIAILHSAPVESIVAVTGASFPCELPGGCDDLYESIRVKDRMVFVELRRALDNDAPGADPDITIVYTASSKEKPTLEIVYFDATGEVVGRDSAVASGRTLEVDGPHGMVAPLGSFSVRPNPTTGRCDVAFQLPEPSLVDIEVLDAVGRTVATIISKERLQPGDHRRSVDLGALPSGSYLVSLRINGTPTLLRVVVAR